MSIGAATSTTSEVNSKQVNSENPFNLVFVKEESSPFFLFLSEKIKNSGLEQLKVIEEIKGKKTVCEILLRQEKPLGIIIYNPKLQSQANIKESFELIYFNAIDPDSNRMLLKRVNKLAEKIHAKSIHITLTEKENKQRQFFLSNKIFISHLMRADSESGLKEYLLVKWLFSESLDTSHREPESRSSITGKRRRESDEVERGEPSLKRGRSEIAPRNDSSFHPKAGFHQLTLRRQYIHQIRDGSKTVEGRIFSGAVLRYRSGDKIRFFYQQNPRDDVTCEIIKVVKHLSFREMLSICGVSKCLADVRDLEEGVRVYDRIPSYTERAARSGVAAIHLKVVR